MLAPIADTSLAVNSNIKNNPQLDSKEKKKEQKSRIRFEGIDDDIPLENSQHQLRKRTLIKSKK